MLCGSVNNIVGVASFSYRKYCNYCNVISNLVQYTFELLSDILFMEELFSGILFMEAVVMKKMQMMND
ncbi:hypothetical protein RchiOBHm_Chr1g0327931 [Rosa chinensis]|uniref:Uncharacterized protein n=1 Tax=Rosa chinensis TaxID=74649 RepID=A0A2P6SAQ3_ROSCH|nr:hypothetical protein RchiOBHm_Chr1g0327931 [Rosa chinensis]